MEPHKQLGTAGEEFAAYALKLRGYKIVARNVHSNAGEIDIVAYDALQEIYILVEVKTRTSEDFVSGIEAVGYKKQLRIQKAAAHFFLNVLRWPYVPEFEIHALVLTPHKTEAGEFEVQYYDDLS